MMYHCYRRGKGIHVRGGKLKNVLMRTDCTYHRMLTKCVQELFSEEEQESNDFYIADSRGVAIWNADKIEVDVEGIGQTARECDWTLEKYIKVSGMKFPSKAHFFCVKKEKGIYYKLLLYMYSKRYFYIHAESVRDGLNISTGRTSSICTWICFF